MKPRDKSPATNVPRNPDQLELATLAARIIGSAGCPSLTPTRAVNMALELWNEAGTRLTGPFQASEMAWERQRIVGDRGKALLVGRHFMPALEPKHFELKSCGFDEFLTFGIGLSEKCDRVKWFRAFLNGWGEHLGDDPQNATYFELASQQPFSFVRTVPIDPFLKSAPTVRSIDRKAPPAKKELAKFRENGVKEPVILAATFRLWRLTMKSPDERAKEALLVEEAILNAKKQKK